MSRYYALNPLAENGFEEIVADDYNGILMEINKLTLVGSLYNGEITINDVPTEWQDEVQRRVDERIAVEGMAEEQEISSDELYSMIEEVL
jgi:hypothetical protein